MVNVFDRMMEEVLSVGECSGDGGGKNRGESVSGLICFVVCSQRTVRCVARLKPIPDGRFASQDDRECLPYVYDFTGVS